MIVTSFPAVLGVALRVKPSRTSVAISQGRHHEWQTRFASPHLDESMSVMQDTSNKAAFVGFTPLPVRVGVARAGTGAAGARRGSRETYRVLRVNHVNKEVCMNLSL
jgi:hypothetical protein